MRTTFAQRTKVYFGLGDDADELAVHQSHRFRKQAVGTLLLLVVGIGVCFWTLGTGLGIILLAVFGFIVNPAVRRYVDRHPRRIE